MSVRQNSLFALLSFSIQIPGWIQDPDEWCIMEYGYKYGKIIRITSNPDPQLKLLKSWAHRTFFLHDYCIWTILFYLGNDCISQNRFRYWLKQCNYFCLYWYKSTVRITGHFPANAYFFSLSLPAIFISLESICYMKSHSVEDSCIAEPASKVSLKEICSTDD